MPAVAAVALSALVVAVAADVGAASRPASKSEARMLLRSYTPSPQVRVAKARISTVNPRWAYVVLAHPQYGNNAVLFRKTGRKWRVVSEGPDMTCDDLAQYRGVPLAPCEDLGVGG
jgi:hypothetical protein